MFLTHGENIAKKEELASKNAIAQVSDRKLSIVDLVKQFYSFSALA